MNINTLCITILLLLFLSVFPPWVCCKSNIATRWINQILSWPCRQIAERQISAAAEKGETCPHQVCFEDSVVVVGFAVNVIVVSAGAVQTLITGWKLNIIAPVADLLIFNRGGFSKIAFRPMCSAYFALNMDCLLACNQMWLLNTTQTTNGNQNTSDTQLLSCCLQILHVNECVCVNQRKRLWFQHVPCSSDRTLIGAWFTICCCFHGYRCHWSQSSDGILAALGGKSQGSDHVVICSFIDLDVLRVDEV